MSNMDDNLNDIAAEYCWHTESLQAKFLEIAELTGTPAFATATLCQHAY